jgi:hypothetical protein
MVVPASVQDRRRLTAAIAAMETGRRFMAASLRRGPDQGEPRLEAGVELAERGARRAVMDFWGYLHGFAQLGVPKRGGGSVGRYHPILRVTETSGGRPMGSPWWQNPLSSALSLLHHPLRVGPSPPGVASANFAHLRVWEVGWGNVSLDLCGVMVR